MFHIVIFPDVMLFHVFVDRNQFLAIFVKQKLFL